jgi:hypothetical protein
VTGMKNQRCNLIAVECLRGDPLLPPPQRQRVATERHSGRLGLVLT